MPRRQFGDMAQRMFSGLGSGDRRGEQLAAERHHRFRVS